jgi:2-phospho-L-lactate guanylyltransferase
MASVVVPFRSGGKTRLPPDVRLDVALAMLGDVLEAAVAFGEALLVTSDSAGALVAVELGVDVVPDPGGGQGAAVAAALARLEGICLVVNADLPRARASDLNALAVPARFGLVGIVEAADGTTNALALPYPEAFAPLYGPRSASRFRARAVELGLGLDELALPNLRDDVDTIEDLDRAGTRVGSRTLALLEALRG